MDAYVYNLLYYMQFSFFLWFLALVGLFVIGLIVLWAVMLRLAKAATVSHLRFEQQLQQALQLGRQLQNLPPPQRAGADAHMLAALMNLDTQMGQLDRLLQQKYESRMGELMGMASKAGINWHP